MADKTYNCPNCGLPIDSRTCDSCGLELDDLFRTQHVDNETVLAGLQGLGAYFDMGTRSLTIPGDALSRPFTIGLNDEGGKYQVFSSFVREAVGCSSKRFSRQDAIEFLRALYHRWPVDRLPRVLLTGDRPQLYLDAEDGLHFPDVAYRPPASQLLPLGADDAGPLFIRYTGPQLVPQDHGGLFEQFVASVKAPDEQNREALRAWLVGTMLAGFVPPGQFPALLLAADSNGVGKTTTAETIAYILGGGLNLPWKKIRGEDDLNRRAMDPTHPCLIADNLEAQGDGLIDDSHLANFITASKLSVKAMYVSTGSVTIPNYTKMIVTANQPALTGELLSRCVIVSLTDRVAGEQGWSSKWRRLRIPLLEDLMYQCIQGWRRGPVGFECDTRFDTWFGLVGRALQRAPVSVPRRTAVKAPIEFVLERAVPQLEAGGSVTLSRLLEWMDGARVGTAAAVCRQRRWNEAAVVADVERYVSGYQIVDGIVKKQEQQ